MKNKNLYLLITLLVLVAGAYYFTGPYQERWQLEKRVVNFLADLDTMQLSEIDVKSTDKDVKLVKVNDEWMVQDELTVKANQQLVINLLNVLAETATGTVNLVSEKTDDLDLYELSEDKRVLLSLKSGDQLIELEVGKNKESYTYLRPVGDNKIYSVLFDIKNNLNQSEWRDLTVFNIDMNQIKSLTVKENSRNRTMTYEKLEEKWQRASDGKAVNFEKFQELLSMLAYLNATDIVNKTVFEVGLGSPTWQFRVQTEEKEFVLSVGNVSGDSQYVKTNQSESIYMVNKEVVKLMQKDPM